MLLSNCHHSRFIINYALNGSYTYICSKCKKECDLISMHNEKFLKGIENGNNRFKK